jgi:hypothetical protein
MTECKIFKPAKTSMQSGRAHLSTWILEYEPTEAKKTDPLMGWIGSGDMNGQLKLKFTSKELAIAYAINRGLAYCVYEPKAHKIQPKNYSDNFSSRFRFS